MRIVAPGLINDIDRPDWVFITVHLGGARGRAASAEAGPGEKLYEKASRDFRSLFSGCCRPNGNRRPRAASASVRALTAPVFRCRLESARRRHGGGHPAVLIFPRAAPGS